MKPPPFHYHNPRSVDEALDCLGRFDNAKLLAGGQSLMPMLNMRYVLPDHIIDLNRITQLSFIRETQGTIEIGAMTRQCELEHSALVRQYLPLMAEALPHIGHVAVRNRGTIGGSLCHLDPSAELPLVAATMDATIEVTSRADGRFIPMEEFPNFYMTPALESQEMVSAIRFAPWPPGHGWAFLEFSRRLGDFAVVAVAALIYLERSRIIDRVKVMLGGVTDMPWHLIEVDRTLIGTTASSAAFKQAARACRKIDATEDVHAPAAYRRHLAEVLTFRALQIAYDRALAGVAAL